VTSPASAAQSPVGAAAAPARKAPLTVADFEAIAREKMERTAFDYYAGGADDELTLTGNRAAFDELWIRPRVLVDASRPDLSLSLFADKLSMPILLAPAALHRLAHPEGERATARAAAAAGITMVVSTISSVALEDVAAASTGTKWFQLYLYRERAVSEAMVRRAEAAGYRALVLTVDTPRLGQRLRDLRNGFQIPEAVRLANFDEVTLPSTSFHRSAEGRTLTGSASLLLHDALTWADVDWLRGITRMPVLVKGVLTAEDAKLALDHGVAGVIVSNHGGRQLDGATPAVRALPEVVDAVAGKIPVLMDGGIRRGTDVLRALALGARAVLIGRPYLWGLAADGEAGVARVLEILRAELLSAMILSGRPSLAGIDRTVLSAPGSGRR
jgi:4-hydroxymandelate oxidase